MDGLRSDLSSSLNVFLSTISRRGRQSRIQIPWRSRHSVAFAMDIRIIQVGRAHMRTLERALPTNARDMVEILPNATAFNLVPMRSSCANFTDLLYTVGTIPEQYQRIYANVKILIPPNSK